MRIARTIGVIGLSCWVGLGCAPSRDYTFDEYVVRPEDTLYSIAWRHDLDYHDLARWNHIGTDFRIAVGQVLTLKPPLARSAYEVPATAASQPHPAAQPAAAPATWVWPTERTTPRPVPGGGVLLLGKLGQPIRAACSGRVVYVGNGIRGYGNLIIIKHGDNLLSAYAHTSEPDVREGQDVQGGTQIARMGEGPRQVAALYFEIRRNGRPIDPLPFLIDKK